MYQTPPALCWRKVRAEGQEVWYNWAINITQHEQPDEMPQYLIDEVGGTAKHGIVVCALEMIMRMRLGLSTRFPVVCCPLHPPSSSGLKHNEYPLVQQED